MARATLSVTIDKNSMTKITAAMKKAVYDAYDNILDDYKIAMFSQVGSSVPVYEDVDPLKSIEEKTGLGDNVNPGHLVDLMLKTIGDIKFNKSYRADNIHMNIFNNARLQAGTRWAGLIRKPYIYYNEDGELIYKGNDNYMTYDDSGYRPNGGGNILSRRGEDGKLKPANWTKNPFPGFGYWAWVNDGTTSRHTFYIQEVYGVLLTGNLTATRFEPTGFQPMFIKSIQDIASRYFV